jgi:2,3-dihydroxybenzoate decarboxylase
MRRVALEEHFVLDQPEHIDRWHATAGMIPIAAADHILPVLRDVGERRLEAMSRAGVDFAVLSNVGSVQGVLDPAAALRLAREANDFLAAAVRQHPDHFAGFATVPLQDPEAGAVELERAVRELGFKGAMIFGHTNGTYLDEDRYRPFWERLEALDVPVYLHASDAMVTPPTYAGRPEMIGPTWSWTAETCSHALRLLLGGVFERHPKARLILGHMGETIPYMLWRLDRRAEAFRDGSGDAKPSETFKKNVLITTAGVFSNEPLLCAIGATGEDNTMFSVDHPFESMGDASRWLDDAPLAPELRGKISSGTAMRVLKL